MTPFPGLNRAQILQVVGLSFYDKTEMDAALAGKASSTHNHTGVYAPVSHNHNDLYYTETEIDALLSGIGAGDTYTQSEIDALLLGKADTSHTHDDRYFTEAEVTSLLAGKSDTGHNHDSRYYTETEVDAAFAALSGVYASASHNHSATAITTGTLDIARLPDLSLVYSSVGHNHNSDYAALVHTHAADDVISGVFANARINWAAPSAIGSGTPAAIGATSLTGVITDTNVSAVVNSVDLAHAVSSGTPTTAFGLGLRFQGHSATPASGLRDMGRIRYDWGVSAADASRKSRAVISVVESGVERDQLIVTGTYTRFMHNGQSPVAYFQFEEGAADGRQRLTHYSDSGSANVIQVRGGVKTMAIGPATGTTYSAEAYGMRGNILLSDQATVIPGAIIGPYGINTGTHKSFFISTPEVAPAFTGTWAKTDIVDLVVFSCAGNAWAGVRPSMRYTALEHIFRTNNGTGANNPGTDIFRVQDTGVRVESALAFHLGDPAVDGTWRITRSGNDLVMQRREAGSWVTKQTVAA